MQGVELSFPAPSHPLSINEANRMHWAAKRRRLEPWKGETRLAWLALGKQRSIVQDKPCTVEVHIPFPDNRRRDPHNYSSTVQKAVIDALVHEVEMLGRHRVVVWEGCWPDDNPEWVKTLEPVLYRGTECRIRIVPNG